MVLQTCKLTGEPYTRSVVEILLLQCIQAILCVPNSKATEIDKIDGKLRHLFFALLCIKATSFDLQMFMWFLQGSFKDLCSYRRLHFKLEVVILNL